MQLLKTMKQALLKQTADEVRQYKPVTTSTKAAAKPRQKPQRQAISTEDAGTGIINASVVQCHKASYADCSLIIAVVAYTWEAPPIYQPSGYAADDRCFMAESSLQIFQDILEGKGTNINLGVGISVIQRKAW